MTTDAFIKKYNTHINFKENSCIQKIKLFHDECITRSKSIDSLVDKKKTNNNSNNNSNIYKNINCRIKKINKLESKNNTENIECNINKQHTFAFTPEEKDKLFWCFYIFIHGYEKYELEKTSSFKIEKEFKFMIAEKLGSLKNELKELGLKKNDIREELTNDKCISIKSLVLMCNIYKINLLYVKNNYYYLIEPDNNAETKYPLKCILSENNKVCIKDIDNNKDEQNKVLLYYKDNYWKIENMNKPIMSFSSYSLLELQDICRKLKLPIENNNKKILKKDLYESIVKVF